MLSRKTCGIWNSGCPSLLIKSLLCMFCHCSGKGRCNCARKITSAALRWCLYEPNSACRSSKGSKEATSSVPNASDSCSPSEVRSFCALAIKQPSLAKDLQKSMHFETSFSELEYAANHGLFSRNHCKLPLMDCASASFILKCSFKNASDTTMPVNMPRCSSCSGVRGRMHNSPD